MDKPVDSWTNTFARLGLSRRNGRGKRGPFKHRSLQFEQLQPREMLATDIVVTGFWGDGNDLVVTYDVEGAGASAFEIGIYRSGDGVTADAPLAAQRVSNSADLEVGTGHTVAIRAEFTDVEEDYFLIAVVDANAEVVEADESNNESLFTGGMFLAADGTLHAHGTGVADSLELAVSTTLDAVLNGSPRSYDTGDVSAIHVRLHQAEDTVTTSSSVATPMWVFGGEGDDYIEGGAAGDELHGGDGEDELRGEAGNDLLLGGYADDDLSGGPGNDTLYGDNGVGGEDSSDGNDFLDGGEGDDVLYGEDGQDGLYGEGNDDMLFGGAGADLLDGGDSDADGGAGRLQR